MRYGRRFLQNPQLSYRTSESFVPFVPSMDSKVLLWWHVADLDDGSVANWPAKVGNATFVQGTAANQPTKSATAIGGAYPGISSDGGDIMSASAVGPILSGKSILSVTAAMYDATSTLSMAMEYSTNAAAIDGAFYIDANEGQAGRLSAANRGTIGPTRQDANSVSLATPTVVTAIFDFSVSGAGSVVAIRANGVLQTLVAGAASSNPGTLANTTLYLFSRSGISVPWGGTFGDIVFRHSKDEDLGLQRIERYVGAQAGISI